MNFEKGKLCESKKKENLRHPTCSVLGRLGVVGNSSPELLPEGEEQELSGSERIAGPGQGDCFSANIWVFS